MDSRYPHRQRPSGTDIGKKRLEPETPVVLQAIQRKLVFRPRQSCGGRLFSKHRARNRIGICDVDGIHLDYIRYPEQGERFPDQATYRKYGKRQDLKQWRRNNITRIVRRIYTETKRLKPWVKVSSSPIGKYRDTGRYSSQGWNAYEEVYQDAQQWLREGIHDALFPMMYFQGNHFYPFALDWEENKNGRWIIPGLGIYFLHPSELNWKLDEVVRQIYFIRTIGLDGQAYFRTRFLLDNTKGIFNELKQHFYPLPAVTPPMTWTDSIAPAKPSSPSFTLLDRGIRFQWKASTDNLSPVYYRLYAEHHLYLRARSALARISVLGDNRRRPVRERKRSCGVFSLKPNAETQKRKDLFFKASKERNVFHISLCAFCPLNYKLCVFASLRFLFS